MIMVILQEGELSTGTRSFADPLDEHVQAAILVDVNPHSRFGIVNVVERAGTLVIDFSEGAPRGIVSGLGAGLLAAFD